MRQLPIKRILLATDLSGKRRAGSRLRHVPGTTCPAAVLTARWRQRLGIPSRQISLTAEELDVDLVMWGHTGALT